MLSCNIQDHSYSDPYYQTRLWCLWLHIFCKSWGVRKACSISPLPCCRANDLRCDTFLAGNNLLDTPPNGLTFIRKQTKWIGYHMSFFTTSVWNRVFARENHAYENVLHQHVHYHVHQAHLHMKRSIRTRFETEVHVNSEMVSHISHCNHYYAMFSLISRCV